MTTGPQYLLCSIVPLSPSWDVNGNGQKTQLNEMITKLWLLNTRKQMIIKPFTFAYMCSCWENLCDFQQFPTAWHQKFDRKSAHTKSIYRIMRKSDMALFLHRFVNHHFFSTSPPADSLHTFSGNKFQFAPSRSIKNLILEIKKQSIKRTTAIQGWEMKNENVILHPKEYQRCAVWECQ